MAGRDETVFQPIPPRKDDDTQGEADRTRFQPLPSAEPDRTQFAPGSATPPAPPRQPFPAVAPSFAPQPNAGMEPGTVLNRMFQVQRLLARDRTGEVFEGVSIGSGERVVVRVVPPAVIAAPAVAAMVYKEVQALIGLSHPALTRYRLVAQEPTLGCHYVVTSFIEGTSLVDVIGRRHPTRPELIGLFRRLAEGLKEAHDAGVIHRDLSSDTVLLEHDEFAHARIVDFGVTKDNSAEAQTVIGPGFAGKMSYAAPEQLGDFDHTVGPWTDVYSLGLVVLALAQGKEADLAGLPVEALRKRRAGVDTSAAPAPLRPVLERMLAADPSQRLRSMDDVLAALAKVRGESSVWPPSRKVMMGGGIAAGLCLIGAASLLMLRGGERGPDTPAVVAAPAGPSVSLAAVDSRIDAVLPSLACSWVSVTTAKGSSGVTLTGAGVAGQPEDVEARIYEAVRAGGANVASSDFSGVAPIDGTFCPMLDSLRTIRATGQSHLTSAQSRYELGWMTEGAYSGQRGAHVILDLSLDGVEGDFALYAIEKSKISEIFPSRAAFLAAAQDTQAIEKLSGTDHYRLTLDGTPALGWSGILLVTGRGGFSEKLVGDIAGGTGRQPFARAAQANGWKAEIAWYRFVDEIPDGPAPLPTEEPAAVETAGASTAASPAPSATPSAPPAKRR